MDPIKNKTNWPTYYLSQNGNDKNDGLNKETPKKTLQSVNGFSDCTILLKSGEEFTLSSINMLYFKAGSNCTISTYGGKAKPIINGYISLDLIWEKTSKNIYKADLKNKGFYTGAKQIYDLCNIGHLLVNGKYNGKRVQTLETLLKNGEYYIDETNVQIYYYSSSSITDLKFKAARNSHAICFSKVSNSSFSGIEIKGFGRHGIWIKDSKFIKIYNNYIHHIGGCKLTSNGSRYGNGIEVWDSGENINCELNRITDCFDAGITNQTISAITQKNISFRKNIVERCWYNIEVYDGRGAARASFSNIIYEDNILLQSTDITKGYRFGAGQLYGALFKVYCVSGNELILKNNICYFSQCYVIYTVNALGLDGITFDGNIYIQKKSGSLYYPTSHTISDNEVLYIINTAPSTQEEYALYAYVLSLINKKRKSFK